MPDTLVINVNRDGPHSIEAPRRFEVSGDFVVDVRNDGEPVHVHVNPDDDLAAGIEIEAGNHFVDRNATRAIAGTVRTDSRPISGKLKVVTGYGSETRYVDVSVIEVATDESSVVVDERLGRPQNRTGKRSIVERATDEFGTAAVLALAAGALALALAALALGADAAIVTGVLVVVAGVAVAISLLVDRS